MFTKFLLYYSAWIKLCQPIESAGEMTAAEILSKIVILDKFYSQYSSIHELNVERDGSKMRRVVQCAYFIQKIETNEGANR